jgi:hypothetical protein
MVCENKKMEMEYEIGKRKMEKWRKENVNELRE